MLRDYLTLRDLIRRAAEKWPDKDAVVDDVARYSYGELRECVVRMAKLLHALGVNKGDRVALLMPPSTSHVIALFGAIELGAIPVALHVRESDALLRKVLEELAPSLLVYDGAFSNRLDSIKQTETGIRAYVRSISGITPDAEMRAENEVTIPRDLEAYQPDLEIEPAAMDDTAVIALSSGTTGVPKGVMHTHRTLVASGRYGVKYMMADENACGLNVFTTAFIGWYNCTLPFLYGGSKIVYLPEWSPAKVLATIAAEQVSVCFLVPTMWRAVLREVNDSTDLSSLRRIGYAGEMMDRSTVMRLREEISPSIINTYGTTETGSWAGCTVMLPEDYRDLNRLESVGRPGEGVELRVIEPGGRVDQQLPPGTDGEIIIRGPSVASSFWKRAELTAKVFENGWWRSGDVGMLDDEGYLYLRGRVDDMIISGGINVLPTQVEEVLLQHPAVSECLVIGVPDEEWGERITAFIVATEEISEQELRNHVERSELSSYKKPRQYRFLESLPRGNTGKANRKLLRESVVK